MDSPFVDHDRMLGVMCQQSVAKGGFRASSAKESRVSCDSHLRRQYSATSFFLSQQLGAERKLDLSNLLASKLGRKFSSFGKLLHFKKCKGCGGGLSDSNGKLQCGVKPHVQRLASWSDYLETREREQAVETAEEEWMVDLSELFLGHKFASGASSRLYHGIYKQKAVAVKIMRQPAGQDDAVLARLQQQFSHEVVLLSRLHHCNVVEFVGACRKPPVFCMITEYLPGGSLRAFLNKNEPQSLSMDMVIRIALDVAKGMEYLHSQGVIHRDLKSENLVLTDDLRVKVADFGISCLESQWDNMKGFNGTYRWMAPELINEKPYSRKVDVYSFGIVLWELLTGLVPFAEMTAVQAAFAVSQKNTRPSVWQTWPLPLSNLMQKCWRADPDKRPEFREVVKSLEQFGNYLSQETHFVVRQKPTNHSSLMGCFNGFDYMSHKNGIKTH
eukprot:c8875_g1_i1 orf=12-1340(-)